MITRVSGRTVRTIRVGPITGSRTEGARMPVMSNLSAHRRPLATAAAAAGVLFALGFVPSAQASPDPVPAPEEAARAASSVSADAVRTAADPGLIAGPRLHEDAGFDTAPYVLGGVGLAGAGGLLAARARHARR